MIDFLNKDIYNICLNIYFRFLLTIHLQLFEFYSANTISLTSLTNDPFFCWVRYVNF